MQLVRSFINQLSHNVFAKKQLNATFHTSKTTQQNQNKPPNAGAISAPSDSLLITMPANGTLPKTLTDERRAEMNGDFSDSF